jgi:hypothetical protein
MGLTALRKKRSIQAKPATRPGGNDPATLNKAPNPRASGAAPAAGPMAPRYQKMLADGVDPAVVSKRAQQFQQRQLPGQQGQAQPGQEQPIGADRPLLPNGKPMATTQPALGDPNGQFQAGLQRLIAAGSGGGWNDSGFSQQGPPGLNEGLGTIPGIPGSGPSTGAGPGGAGGAGGYGTPGSSAGTMASGNSMKMPPPPGAGGWQDTGFAGGAGPMAKPAVRPNPQGGGLAPGVGVPMPLPNGRPPMRNMIASEPIQGGNLSPAAWGALGGGANPDIQAAMNAARGAAGATDPVQAAVNAARGAGGGPRPMIPNESGGNLPPAGPLLPNGQPWVGAYGNDAQAREIGGGVRSMSAGVPQGPPGGIGAPGGPDLQSLNGGGLQGGPAAGGIAAVPGDPQARQAAIVRGLAGRMAGGRGAFNQ